MIGVCMTSRVLLLVQCLMAAGAVAVSPTFADLVPGSAGRWLAFGVAMVSAGLGVYNAHVGTMPKDFRYPASDEEARVRRPV